MATTPVPLNQYQVANAVHKIDGYYLTRPSDVTDPQRRAFDRAKAECIENMAAELEHVKSMTFEKFCVVKKIKVATSAYALTGD